MLNLSLDEIETKTFQALIAHSAADWVACAEADAVSEA